MTRTALNVITVAAAGGLLAALAVAGPPAPVYEIDWYTLEPGDQEALSGDDGMGTTYALIGVIGQPDATGAGAEALQDVGGVYELVGGFGAAWLNEPVNRVWAMAGQFGFFDPLAWEGMEAPGEVDNVIINEMGELDAATVIIDIDGPAVSDRFLVTDTLTTLRFDAHDYRVLGEIEPNLPAVVVTADDINTRLEFVAAPGGLARPAGPAACADPQAPPDQAPGLVARSVILDSTSLVRDALLRLDGVGFTTEMSFVIADGGIAEFRVLDGAPLSRGSVTLGANPSSVGLASVRGGSWSVDVDSFVIGDKGRGRLEVLDGGLLCSRSGQLRLAASTALDSAAEADVLVDGTGSRWREYNAFAQVGDGGPVVMTVTNGGEIQIPTIQIKPGSTLQGNGTVIGNVQNIGVVQAGIDALAGAPTTGMLSIEGDYTQISLDGKRVGTTILRATTDGGLANDMLSVADSVEIDGGGLLVTELGTFAPGPADSLDLIVNADSFDAGDRFDVAFMPRLEGTKFMRVRYDTVGTAQVSIEVADLVNDIGLDNVTAGGAIGVPEAAVVAQLDNDAEGREDLAVAIPDPVSPLSAPGTVVVFLNAQTDGAGNFIGFSGSPVTTTVGVNPRGLTVGDLDGDLLLDLAVSNAGNEVANGTVQVLGNVGSGSFATLDIEPVGVEPRGLGAGRFTRGDVDDLLVPNAGSDTLTMLVNNGDGDFMPMQVAGPADGLQRPILVDPESVGGDKDIDAIILSTGNDMAIAFMGDGNGGLAVGSSVPVGASPSALTTGDYNGDGLIDVATANEGSADVSVILNGGGGTLRPAVNLPVGDGPRSITSVDLDLDGDLDLAVVAAESGVAVVQVLRNDVEDAAGQPQLVFADARVVPAGTDPVLVVAGDVDGNASDDLVTVNAGGGFAAAQGGAPVAYAAGVANGRDGGAAQSGPVPPGSVQVVLNDFAGCRGDTNFDGEVDVNDLNNVILDWGSDGSANGGDLTGPLPNSPADGIVNVNDLNAVIVGWGACP